MWLNIYLNPSPGHAGLETCSIDPLRSIELFATYSQTRPSSLSPDMNWVVSFLHLHTPPKVWTSVVTRSHVSCSIATAFHTPHMTLITDQSTTYKGVKISLHSSSLIKKQVSSPFPYKYQPSSGLSSSLLMKTSCLRLKLVELNSFASFNADDQRKTYVSNVSKYKNIHTTLSCWATVPLGNFYYLI